MDKLNHVFAGVSLGIIIFQSLVVAPLVFTQLKDGAGGPFLRALFPRFFIALSTLGLALLINALIAGRSSIALLGTLAMISGMIAYAIIPATNRARDAGNALVFKRLHFASVVLMLGIAITDVLAVVW